MPVVVLSAIALPAALARQISPAGISSSLRPSGSVTVSAASPPSATDEAPTIKPIWTMISPGRGPAGGTADGGLAQPRTIAAAKAQAMRLHSAAVIAKLELDA